MTDKEIEHSADNVSQGMTAQTELDTAGKSLTEALRTSFMILKVVMVILVILFITSGIFRVQENENALVLRFGEIRGTGTEQRVLGSGLHWAWPEPICEIIKIPVTKKQSLPIDLFWYYQTEAEKLGTARSSPGDTLNPIFDGYCLTRNDSITGAEGTDYNIVHAKWTLTYVIADPEEFFKHIYYRASRPGEDFLDVMAETVEPLLTTISANAVVSEMVKHSIEEAIQSKSDIPNNIARAVQSKLDRINSGIDVVSMQADKIIWPRQVNVSFEAATMVKQISDQTEKEAGSYARTILTEAGGTNAESILADLKAADNDEEKQKLLGRLEGASREIIANAWAQRVEAVARAEANAQYLKKLLPEYRKHPDLVLQKIHRDTVAEVLENADEKFFVQSSGEGSRQEVRVEINRDPAIARGEKKERE